MSKGKTAKQWLKHAFAIETANDAEPTLRQREIVSAVCSEIRRRRMVEPARMVLEMSRPLNYLAAQTMHFFQPFLTVVVQQDAYQEFASFLEQRGAIDYICRQLGSPDSDE